MSKNKQSKMRNGTAVAALSRTSAGPMRHRLALRGNARSVAEAEAIDEGESERELDYNELALAFEY